MKRPRTYRGVGASLKGRPRFAGGVYETVVGASSPSDESKSTIPREEDILRAFLEDLGGEWIPSGSTEDMRKPSTALGPECVDLLAAPFWPCSDRRFLSCFDFGILINTMINEYKCKGRS
jgi:hypothetical protein